MTLDQDALAWRTRQAFDLAHEDLDAAIDRRDLSGLVRAAYVLGRIAEQLDGHPSDDDVVEQWNEAARRFNGASRNHRSSFQLGEMNPRQVLTQRADNPILPDQGGVSARQERAARRELTSEEEARVADLMQRVKARAAAMQAAPIELYDLAGAEQLAARPRNEGGWPMTDSMRREIMKALSRKRRDLTRREIGHAVWLAVSKDNGETAIDRRAYRREMQR